MNSFVASLRNAVTQGSTRLSTTLYMSGIKNVAPQIST